jgi:hypothetical protein
MTARVLVFLGALSLLAAGAQTLPTTEFQTLAGSKLTVPGGAGGRAALFIVGFRRASSKPTSAWDKQLEEDCAETGTVCYTVAVLEDVPRFIRGMVVSGIRSGIPEQKRSRFLILLHGEDVWKKVCGFSDADGAYLVLVSGGGQIVWKWAGPPDGASLAAARERLREAAKN